MKRYTVVYEGDPNDSRILNGEAPTGLPIGVCLGDLIAEDAARRDRERRPDLPHKPTPQDIREAFSVFADLVQAAGGDLVIRCETADDEFQVMCGRPSHVIGLCRSLTLAVEGRMQISFETIPSPEAAEVKP